MNHLKPVLVTYILPIVAVMLVAIGYANASSKTGSKMYMCKQKFALCTSALCVPQPGNPNKVTCFCDVEDGPHLTSVPCNQTASRTDKYGIQTVFSAYSPKQFASGKKGMMCPSGTPWSWCLNKVCTVDPTNPKKAICTCDVVRSPGKWMTLGGNCNTATCATGYWSGATLEDIDSGTKFLMAALGKKEWPIKWCPNTPPGR